jgi:hypothetical protein
MFCLRYGLTQRANTQSATLKEGSSINSSLTVLGRIINMLADAEDINARTASSGNSQDAAALRAQQVSERASPCCI